MARIRIQVTDAGLVATAEVAPGPATTTEELQAALREARVTFGIDAAAIAGLARSLADPDFRTRVVVARGQAARPGDDGRLDGLPPRTPLVGTTRADGSIDWHEREFLHPAASGQALATMVAATPGVPGCSVTAQPLPPKPGKPCTVRLGAGVTRDGDRIVAQAGGVVLHDDRQIDVVPLFVHGADVDVSSGNLHSKGSLVVRGDVTSGHAVAADGDVHVTGAVLDGNVQAGGSIRVDQGALGEHATLVAGHDVAVRHATSARLQAGHAVVLADQATHCRARATAFLARAGRGTVFGGEVRVKRSIAVRTAGTAQGAATRLVVADTSERAADSVRATNTDQRTAALAARRLEGNGGPGKAQRQNLRAADQALAERIALQQARRELLADATIEIDETCHPGVVLVFGETVLTIVEPRRHVRFRWCRETDSILEERLP